MNSLAVTDVRPFVPAPNLALSRDFYCALGWTLLWEDQQLALMAHGEHAFYLHHCGDNDLTDDCMLFVEVENAQAWHTHVAGVLASKKFSAAKLYDPKVEQYGALVVHVKDPSGVLLHLVQPGEH